MHPFIHLRGVRSFRDYFEYQLPNSYIFIHLNSPPIEEHLLLMQMASQLRGSLEKEVISDPPCITRERSLSPKKRGEKSLEAWVTFMRNAHRAGCESRGLGKLMHLLAFLHFEEGPTGIGLGKTDYFPCPAAKFFLSQGPGDFYFLSLLLLSVNRFPQATVSPQKLQILFEDKRNRNRPRKQDACPPIFHISLSFTSDRDNASVWGRIQAPKWDTLKRGGTEETKHRHHWSESGENTFSMPMWLGCRTSIRPRKVTDWRRDVQ